MIKILVTAPRGHMDSLIIREAVRSSDIEVAGAVGPCGREYIGRDAGELCGIGAIGVTVSDDIEKIIEDCDVVVDYSQVEFSMQVLETCVRHRHTRAKCHNIVCRSRIGTSAYYKRR